MQRRAISLLLALPLALTAMIAAPAAYAQHSGTAAAGEQPNVDVGALLKYLDGLPDLNASPAEERAFDTSKPVVGFGFQFVDGDVRIVRVLEGSAAESAGLEVGMIIDRINGARLGNFTLEEIAKLIAAIDGELTFAIRDTGNIKLRKAPIEQQGS